MNEQLIALAIQFAPELISLLKDKFHKANPDAPMPSDEEVVAAYQEAFRASVDKDDRWVAAHPE